MTAHLKRALGGEAYDAIRKSKILVVGAGGIGCELLKNLVLSGFVNLHIIDLDTIDVSNLNRQFLFRSKHVTKSKAIIAKEIVNSFSLDAKIEAHYKNVKASEFGISFFSEFSLVFNALDNIDARKHVNRLCLSTKVPLIESGTTGYLGQVSVIKKGETECYECTPKITSKVYPICTIRSTPDKMVHCIVWAKECYKLLFGNMEDSMLWEDPNGHETSTFMPLVTQSTCMDLDDIEACEQYAWSVFRGLFDHEIQKKIGMNLYKTAEKTPKSLILEDIIDMARLSKKNRILISDQATNSTFSGEDKRSVWSLSTCVEYFQSCIVRMLHNPSTRQHLGTFEFEKDDSLAMEFVTAAANLRATVFNIPRDSFFNCKGIAGNIIPAIATTNAIVAGLQVLEAFRILQAHQPISQACHYTYCNQMWDSRGVLLNPVKLSPPSSTCLACNQHMTELAIDTERTTLREFIGQVLKGKLGMNEPTISIGASTIYEEGECAEESLCAHLDKVLSALPGSGIHDDTIVLIEDFSQDFQCRLHVSHCEFDDQAAERFILGTCKKGPTPEAVENAVVAPTTTDKSFMENLHKRRRL
uniref:SUMO-activating enzyme subunit n=1 Tax=Albugo laibachii Nc14 TaxID=890382 RepID=F0W128_9STRA|nr:ubiquitinactivating enzyme (E1) putative [Albugo laibachii Nc14]|eukprot:CCA14752.1 ubiquitinactivating enzyme (E1) putative [Albugo laibachii Nc14]